jgi:glycosyltransferase involved in cell wall biosynthesis
MSPLVSVLIPSFNSEQWIKQTLVSAINQDYPRIEVIVVDDGSTDQSLEIARTFESRSIQVITQPNAGAPAARNTALAHAQGEYIQWLDADDLLAPNKISAQMQSRKGVESDRILLSCPFATFYYRLEKARLFDSGLYQDLAPADYFLIKFARDTFLQTAAWLVSRKLTDLAGLWWELRSPDDDGEYFCRVVAAAEGIQFVPQTRCYWRVGNKGSVSWGWTQSQAGLEALFQSTARSIQHFRTLEDSERSRAACISFLQNRLIYFYPNPYILEKINALAEDLGGTLGSPTLSWKYSWINAAFGWQLAKRCRLAVPAFKNSLIRDWDYLMYNIGAYNYSSSERGDRG